MARLEPKHLRLAGTALFALGLAGILWGVLHVLEQVGTGRQSYDTVKLKVHASFFGGLLRGLGGLLAAWLGLRLRARALAGREDPGSR